MTDMIAVRGVTQVVRQDRGARRHRPHRRARRDLRPARTERRRQDHPHQHPQHPRRARRRHRHRRRIRRRAPARAGEAQISLTGQSAAVDEVLTGDENLRMMGALSGLGRADAARRSRELLERFELDRQRPQAGRRPTPAGCGGGSTWRSACWARPRSCSSTSRPPGSTRASRQELWDVIRHLADNGTTVLLTTQYLEEADQLADRIAVLERGRIVAEGTPDELKSRIGGEVVELHDADGAVVREIPTDGTVAGLRAALDGLDDSAAASVVPAQPQPRRRLPRPSPERRTDHDHPHPARRPRPTRLAPLTAEATFIKRSIIHTLRTPDALIMAIALPMHPDAAVHVRVRRRDRGGRQLRRTTSCPASSCSAPGSARPRSPSMSRTTCRPASSTGSAPCRCAASAVITGHVVASLLRNLLATGDRHRRRRSRSASARRDVRSTGSP